MDFRGLWTQGVHTIERNLPAILSATAIIGTGVTAFLTGKATLNAYKKLKNEEAASEVPLTKTEKFKLVYTDYIPVAISAALTVGCIVGANRSAAQQIATVIAAGRNLEKQLTDNRSAVNQVFGDRGLRKVDEKINEERAGTFFANENSVYETGHGSMLCCEGFLTGTLFRADREWVRKCVNDFNMRLIDGEILSYNDFIQMLIPTIDINVLPNAGEVFGYNLDIRRRTLEIVEDSFITRDSSMVGYIFNVRELPLLNYTVQY